jgi:energy-converting hydrogenase Eha subunit C
VVVSCKYGDVPVGSGTTELVCDCMILCVSVLFSLNN